jgi:hypothetical protein
MNRPLALSRLMNRPLALSRLMNRAARADPADEPGGPLRSLTCFPGLPIV